MAKSIPAILAAFAITAVVGLSMLVIGGNALLNPNTVVMASAPAASDASANPSSAADSQTAQMQALIQQYQDREKQYQSRLDEAVQKLNQANQQIQQANEAVQSYQQIMVALQRRGVIRVDQNGQIFMGRGVSTSGDDH